MLKSLKYLLMSMAMLPGAWPQASAADRFYIEPVNIEPGEACILAFKMDNSQPMYGFQADIDMPQGLAIATVDGKADCSLSARANDSYTIVSNLLSESQLRVGTFSLTHTPLTGSDGDLLYINVKASDDFAGGVLSIANIYAIDASDNDFIMPDYSIEIGTVHDDRLYMSDERMDVGSTKSVSLILDNETVFTAFQADIHTSPGLNIDENSFALASRVSDGHSISYMRHSEDMIRIAVFSPANNPFDGHSGDVVTFDITALQSGLQSVTLKNIRFSTPDAREYLLPESQATVTVDQPLSLTDKIQDPDDVSIDGATITVKGLAENEEINIFGTDGTVKYNAHARGGIATVTVNPHSVYILKGKKIYIP